MTLEIAARALLSDIQSMQTGRFDFGPFYTYETTDGDGAIVEWPNLAISVEGLQAALAQPSASVEIFSWYYDEPGNVIRVDGPADLPDEGVLSHCVTLVLRSPKDGGTRETIEVQDTTDRDAAIALGAKLAAAFRIPLDDLTV